ncbi:hypothetical protein CDSM653_01027 [Caldanaerobacter subterraneus subsp. pacificus DSM 12653]|uniref:Uncharacterized protein n=2 Tax=Caldanaerobacter subterraneus TaxID=911092 RepID=A0A0F5PMV4_9THEO|nr:hypothetical protein CDSM653_01027 [Caldanaerobacter subterraneus subsp. pacificus DSM 12653]
MEELKNVKKIDYIIAHHTKDEHSCYIREFLENYRDAMGCVRGEG